MCASAAHLGLGDSTAALASTLVVASKNNSWPRTGPASTHAPTMRSKKRRKTAKSKRS